MNRVLCVAILVCAFAGIALAQNLPRPDHIVIVFEENKNVSDVIPSSNAPYINGTLVPLGAQFTAFSAFHHPSQPNYIEFFAGTNQLWIDRKTVPICGDSCLAEKSTRINLFTAIRNGKRTFGGWAEDLPPVAGKSPADICEICYFAARHCPWLNFTDVPNRVSHPTSRFPQMAKGFAALPTISIVIPNLIHDMHSTNAQNCNTGPNDIPTEVAFGDAWLKQNMNNYVQWAMKHNSLFIMVFDENEGTEDTKCVRLGPGQNVVPLVIVGQPVKSGVTVTTPYNPYDLLRTILTMYDLDPFGGAKNANVITGIWNQ
jgi:acid phosphatase